MQTSARAILALFLPFAQLSAQARVGTDSSTVPSPVSDLITQARDAINNLRFEEALQAARGALAQRRIRPQQLRTVHHLMAAAFYPDPSDSPARQSPDSARHYLALAVQLQPDAELPEELRWRGLDSLYTVVRAGTIAAVADPPAVMALSGFDGRGYIDVVAARPASMRLLSRDRRSGATVLHDSVASATKARLALRAHDGVSPLFQTGEYDVTIEVNDIPSGERRLLTYAVSASGIPPVLDRPPPLDSARLKPERMPKALGRGIASAIVFSAATVAIATYARAENPVRTAFPRDSRALPIAVAVGLGSLAGGILDKGRPIPTNAAENRGLRAQHAEQVASVMDANRKKAAEYKVELRIAVEAR